MKATPIKNFLPSVCIKKVITAVMPAIKEDIKAGIANSAGIISPYKLEKALND